MWAEPGNTILFSRTVNELTNIWNYNFKDQALTQITFGTGPDFSPMRDPGGKGIYFVNGKSSGFLTVYHVHSKESTDIISRTQSAHHLAGWKARDVHHATPSRSESSRVSDIDGGNKVKIAAGEALRTGTWARTIFTCPFSDQELAQGKAYIVGADGSGLRRLPRMGDILWGLVWSPDQKSVYVTGLETKRGSPIPVVVWKWNVDGSNLEMFADNCGLVTAIDPGEQFLLSSVLGAEKTGIYEMSISDRKCISLIPGAVAAVFAHETGSRSCMQLLPVVKSPFSVSLGWMVNSPVRPRLR